MDTETWAAGEATGWADRSSTIEGVAETGRKRRLAAEIPAFRPVCQSINQISLIQLFFFDKSLYRGFRGIHKSQGEMTSIFKRIQARRSGDYLGVGGIR